MKKKRELRFFPVAEEDIAEILDYIALDKVFAAVEFYDKLEKRFERLSEYLHSGTKRNEYELAKAGYYSFVYGNYIIFYTIEEESLTIHRIFSSYQDYLRFFNI